MNTNTPTQTVNDKALHRLRSCKMACLGRERIYELLCEGTDGERFFISVREGEEEEVAQVTCPFSRVAILFDRIVRGEVAPFILLEILEDFEREME